MRVRLRVRVRLGQMSTLHLWDVASKAKNGYRTHSLHLRQIANKNAQYERTLIPIHSQ